MANLLKVNKRGGLLPRVANGDIAGGERYGEWTSPPNALAREMPPMLSTLDIWSGSGDERVEYHLQLTDDEVIRVCGEWLSKLASRRSREKLDARNKAAKEAARGQ